MDATESRDFLALNDTLLSYFGDKQTLQIPEKLNGRPIRIIGKGAISERPSLKRIIVPEQIKRIGDQAFSNCEGLEQVVFSGALPELGRGVFDRSALLRRISLHRFPATEEQLRQLRENSCPMADGSLAAERFPDWESLKQLKLALPVAPLIRLPKTANCIFQHPDDDASLTAEEERRFLELIRSREETPRFPETEAANDLALRRDRVPKRCRVALFCVDEQKSERGEKGWLLRARILMGPAFWQSKVCIRSDGQDYYLYHRNYLNSDAKLEYVRKNRAVFTERGIERNERKVGEIYAKYQLSSIL